MAIDVGCHTGVRWRGADDSLENSLHGNSFGFPPRTSLPDPSKFVPCLGFPGEGPAKPTTPRYVSRRRGAYSDSAGRAGQFRPTSGLSHPIVPRKRVSFGGGGHDDSERSTKRRGVQVSQPPSAVQDSKPLPHGQRPAYGNFGGSQAALRTVRRHRAMPGPRRSSPTDAVGETLRTDHLPRGPLAAGRTSAVDYKPGRRSTISRAAVQDSQSATAGGVTAARF
jgi:hypothetical protein